MNETSEQYIKRILSNVKGKDSLNVLKATPKKLATLLYGINKKYLYKKPTPDKWSVGEIIAHLAEAELVLGWRYRSVVEKNGVTIEPFEQDDWAKNSQYSKLDVFAMLTMFGILRNANIKFLSGLPKSKLKNFGMHQERGKETIVHIMNMEAGHDLNHLKQIEKILKNKK